MHGGSVTYKGRYLKVRRWSAGFWWTGPHNSALTMHSSYWLELSLQIAENWRKGQGFLALATQKCWRYHVLVFWLQYFTCYLQIKHNPQIRNTALKPES